MKALLKLTTSFLLIFILFDADSQEFTAGINTETPNPNAVLHLVSPNGDQGLLVPSLTTAQRITMALTATDNGLMVFDTDDNGFYFWVNPGWVQMSNTDEQDLANVLSQSNDAAGNQIKNVANPTDPQDVATKDYVDTRPSQDPVSTDGGNILITGGDGGAYLDFVDFANVINTPPNLDIDATDDLTLTSAPAAGDISGDYSSGFQINPGIVTSLEISDGTITDADVGDVAVGKITGAPNLDLDATDDLALTTVPAAGDITGDFQSGLNIGVGVVSSLEIADGTITDTDVNDVSVAKITGLGSAATLDAGVADGNLVQVQTGGALPILDGSALTGVIASTLSDGTSIIGDGTTGNELSVAAVDPILLTNGGAIGGEVLEYNGTNWVPVTPSTVTLSDGTSIIGDGTTGNELSVAAVDPILLTNGGAIGGEVLEYNGTNWVPVTPSTVTLSDGTSIIGDGTTGNELSVAAVDPILLTNGGAIGGEVLEYNGTNWVPVTPSTVTLSDGTSIIGDGTTGNELSVAAVDPILLTNGGAIGGEVLEYNGTNWVPVAPSTVTLSDGTSIIGDGTTGNELSVAAVDPILLTNGGAIGGEVLEYNGTNWVPVAPTSPLNSGNGVTINTNNIDLGGTLTAPAAISPTVGNDLQISNGGGNLNVQAPASFTANASFSSIDVTGGAIAGANLTQRDNVFTLEDDGDGTKRAQFDLATIGTGITRTFNLPDQDGTIALLSDLTSLVAEPTAGSIIGGTNAAPAVTGINNTVYGLDAGNGLTSGTDNVLIGRNAANGGTPLTTGSGNTIIGSGAITSGGLTGNAVAVGHLAEAGGSNTVALGFNTTSTGLRSVAIGANTNASQDGTIILGDGIAANSTYSVGIGTDDPRSSLQIGGEFGLSHFENATEGINGDAILSNVYPDYASATDNQLRRTNGTDSASFIFFDDGEIQFLHVPNGAANSLVDISNSGDVGSWMGMRNDGNISVDGGLELGSPDPGEETAGMIQWTGSDFEGNTDGSPGGWVSLTGGAVTNLNSDITFANGTNRQIRIEDGAGGNSLTVSPGTGLGIDGGNLVLNGGGSDNNAGGDVDINGGTSPGDGGSITIDGGNGNGGGGSGLGGAITLKAGDGAAIGGNAGPISITAGSTLSSGGDTAGDVNITAGNGGGSSAGGNIRLNAGTSGGGTDGAVLINGAVGIGTNLPRREFHLNGAGGISFQMTNAASGAANQNTGFVIDYNDTDQTVDFRHYQDRDIAFGSSITRNLYVDNVNGRVGVGTITPGSTLDVNGDISVGATLSVSGTVALDQDVSLGSSNANNIQVNGELTVASNLISPPSGPVNDGFTPTSRIIRVAVGASINNIGAGAQGQEIILITDGAADFGESASIDLETGSFNPIGAFSTLHLVFVGSRWVEISRTSK